MSSYSCYCGRTIIPDGRFVYFANHGQSTLTNTVSVIDTNTNTNAVTDTVPLGYNPIGVAIANIECSVSLENTCNSL